MPHIKTKTGEELTPGDRTAPPKYQGGSGIQDALEEYHRDREEGEQSFDWWWNHVDRKS